MKNHARKKHPKPEDLISIAKRAEAVETGNESNICSECSKHFSERNAMRTHVKVVHRKIKDYSCHKCDFICGQKGNLDAHMKRKHQETIYPNKKQRGPYVKKEHKGN